MKKIVIAFINLTLSLVLIFALIRPVFDPVMGKRALLAEQTAKIGEVKEILNETEKLKQEYLGISKEAEEFFRALPAEKDIPHFLVEVEELAKNNGLLLESVSFEPGDEEEKKKNGAGGESKETTGEALNKLNANLSLSGSYNSFKGYLIALESSLRPISINSVSLTVNPTVANVFEFKLGLSVYYAD